jgi:hypothetical protein
MDWGYVSGFWDGEGWISSHTKNKWPYWNIGCCQSTPQDECLRQIQTFLESFCIQTKIHIARGNGPRRHPVSKLYVGGDRDNKIRFLSLLIPRLIVKKAKAEETLRLLREMPRIVVKGEALQKRIRYAYEIYVQEQCSMAAACRKVHVHEKALRNYIKELSLPIRSRGKSIWITRRKNAANAV